MFKMNAGYARADITPKESVPLAGYGNTSGRMSQTVLDPLYATCVAFEDGTGARALVFTIDLINGGKTTTTHIRPAISQVTGIPVSHIQVSGTHSHATPDTLNENVESVGRYLQYLQEQMVQAAVDALADLKPAQLFLTRTTTKNMNFVRHYLMADGTYTTPNFGNHSQPIAGHESDADPVMQLAKITREGGKDIILCNFGVHQTDTGGQKKYDVSADIAGAMRAEYEARTDCCFAYFTGACGNVNPVSKIKEENVVPEQDHVAHGKALANYALNAADAYVSADFGPIRAASSTREYAINHATDHLAPQGKKVWDLYVETNDRDLANKLAREYGFSSVYHANAVAKRKEKPAADAITINALCVGDLAFALAPYEMFDTNGMEIKKNSPFEMTMVLTLANQASIGYLPTRMSFEHGSYAADTCRFSPGIGEALAEEFVELLKQIKAQ